MSFFRALVRVVAVQDGWMTVCVPAWNHRENISISLIFFKPEDRKKFKPNYRCHAQVNIGVDKKYDLAFKDWELPGD